MFSTLRTRSVVLALCMLAAVFVFFPPSGLFSAASGRTALAANFAGNRPAADPQPVFRKSLYVHDAAPSGKVAPTSFPATYTVVAGDSLSSIATRFYGSDLAWTWLYYANKDLVTCPEFEVMTGQELEIPAPDGTIPAAPACQAPSSPPAPSSPSAPPASPAPPPPPSGGGAPAGSFEACVIQHESGGVSTAWYPGHTDGSLPPPYDPVASGLFGFLLSTWQGLGLGYPQGAAYAPVSVQDEGFAKLYAEAGTSPWAGDGCAGGTAAVTRATLLADYAHHPHPDFNPPPAHKPSKRLEAFDWAKKHESGCWYHWGGVGPCGNGYDCSGAVMMAYKAMGISMERTVAEMAAHSLTQIPERDAHRGDVVVWGPPGGEFHIEFVAYAHDGTVRYTFGAHDQGTRVGTVRIWATEYHRFFMVKGAGS